MKHLFRYVCTSYFVYQPLPQAARHTSAWRTRTRPISMGSSTLRCPQPRGSEIWSSCQVGGGCRGESHYLFKCQLLIRYYSLSLGSRPDRMIFAPIMHQAGRRHWHPWRCCLRSTATVHLRSSCWTRSTPPSMPRTSLVSLTTSEPRPGALRPIPIHSRSSPLSFRSRLVNPWLVGGGSKFFLERMI